MLSQPSELPACDEANDTIPLKEVFFSRFRIMFPRAQFFLLFFLFSLPFQMSLYQYFGRLALRLIPPGMVFPFCFCRQILFYTTDICFFVFLIVLICSIRIQWIRSFCTGPAKYLMVFACLSVLSLCFSEKPFFPLQYFKLFQYSLPLLLFCLIPGCFDAKTFPPFLRIAFLAVFIAALFQAAIAILQYFLQHSLGLCFLGEEIWGFCFPAPGGELWVFDKIFHCLRGIDQIRRSAGTTVHPNVLGGLLFFSLMASYALYFEFFGKRINKIILCGIFLQIIALFLTFSRSAMGASVLGTAVWFWSMRYLIAIPSKDKKARKIILPLLLTLIIGVGSCITLFYPATAHRGALNNNATVQQSGHERIEYQKAALRMIAAHPLFGVGYNNYQLVKDRYDPEGQVTHLWGRVHNIYLLIGSEQGLLALAAFLLFLFSVLRRALRADVNAFHASLIASFCGFLFIGLFDFYPLFMNNMMFIFFSVCALLVVPSLFQLD